MAHPHETRTRTTRHPLAWLVSHTKRRRGVANAAPAPVTASEVLERLATLPVSTWTYTFDHESVRHIGPMAQDFAATFGVGSSDRRIDTVDALGVCMAGIQALHRRLVEVEGELAYLKAEADKRG